MRCLSVCQPFADLITSGRKTVELRRWNTLFRGEFLVHAPARVLNEDCRRLGVTGDLVTAAIVGRAVLHDIKRYSSDAQVRADRRLHLASPGRYGCGGGSRAVYGFVLRDARPLRVPIPYRGRLGLFEANLPGAGIGNGDIVPGIADGESRRRRIGRR